MVQNNSESMWDVVIIGAGVAGLTASIYLAKAGKSVLLLDRASQIGGRAASTEMAAARVNLGPHALYRSALTILQEVGVKPQGASAKPPGQLLFKGANGKSKAVPLVQLLLGSFLSFNEKVELIRFYSRIRKEDTSTLHSVTLSAYLDSHNTSPRVRSIVGGLVRVSTYSDAPDRISAGAVIEQLKQAQVMYINGGWQTIVNDLAEQARQAGVSIRTSAPAQQIAGSSPSMMVTLKDGTILNTRHVLSTAGPVSTLAVLNPAPSKEEEAIYQQLTPVHAACLDLVVSGMPRPKLKFVLGADYPLYYSNHSAGATLTDDPSHSVIHVMKYLTPGERSDPKQDERELNEFLDVIQPGWRKHVVEQRFLPHMLVSHGLVTAANGGLPNRPGPAVESRPGLYMIGDWVGGSGMLLNASLASAKEAADRIVAGNEQDKEGIYRGA